MTDAPVKRQREPRLFQAPPRRARPIAKQRANIIAQIANLDRLAQSCYRSMLQLEAELAELT